VSGWCGRWDCAATKWKDDEGPAHKHRNQRTEANRILKRGLVGIISNRDRKNGLAMMDC
jgi:hypothetical protein